MCTRISSDPGKSSGNCSPCSHGLVHPILGYWSRFPSIYGGRKPDFLTTNIVSESNFGLRDYFVVVMIMSVDMPQPKSSCVLRIAVQTLVLSRYFLVVLVDNLFVK